MAFTVAAGIQLMTPFTKRRKTNKPEKNYLDINLRDKGRVKMNERINYIFTRYLKCSLQ